MSHVAGKRLETNRKAAAELDVGVGPRSQNNVSCDGNCINKLLFYFNNIWNNAIYVQEIKYYLGLS